MLTTCRRAAIGQASVEALITAMVTMADRAPCRSRMIIGGYPYRDDLSIQVNPDLSVSQNAMHRKKTAHSTRFFRLEPETTT